MRQSPSASTASSSTSHGQQQSITSTATNAAGHGSSTDKSELSRRRERVALRRSKQNKQKVVRAEEYEDHKFKDPDIPIESILEFIEGSEGDNRKGSHSNTKKHSGKEPASHDLTAATAGKEALKATTKKKPQGGKKDNRPILNGQPSVEELSASVDKITSKTGVSAMGNSVTSLTEDNDQNFNIGQDSEKIEDFYDCQSNSEEFSSQDTQRQKLTTTKEKDKTKSPKEENRSSQAHSETLNIKGGTIKKQQQSKAKQTSEKKDSSGFVILNGPTKANMVKSNQESVHAKTDNTPPKCPSSPELDTAPNKREEMFVEVKKKKKRVGPKENSVLPTAIGQYVSNQYYNRNGNGAVGGQYGSRNNGHQRQPRSSTPPGTGTPSNLVASTATSLANSASSITHVTMATATPIVSSSNSILSISNVNHAQSPPILRDLSPSAFPVLESHSIQSQPAGEHARRNSCGDASDLLVESKSLCDSSDRESVKSLPATSPLYPVSYARMAAGSAQRPRPTPGSTSDCVVSPSSDSGQGWNSSSSSSGNNTAHTTPAPHTPERKASTAVWKGSPRERRHSIGSSPADEKQHNSSGAESVDSGVITGRSRQKSGSSEVLNRDVVLTASPVTVEDNNGSDNIESDAQQVQSVINQTLQTTSPLPSKSISSTTLKKSDASTVTAEVHPPSKTICDSSVPLSEQKHVVSEPSEVAPVKGGPNVISPITKTGSASSVTSGGSNNTRSVVFLDKRVTSSPAQSLGITFGFDLSIDAKPTPDKDSNNIKAAGSKPDKQHAAITVLPNTVPTSQSPKDILQNIPSSLSSISTVTSTQSIKFLKSPSCEAISESAFISKDKAVPKEKSVDQLSNGLIFPVNNPQQPQQSHNKPHPSSGLAGQVRPMLGSGGRVIPPFSPNYPPPPLPQPHNVVVAPTMAHQVAKPRDPRVPSPPESQDIRKLGCVLDVSQPPPISPLQHQQQNRPQQQPQQTQKSFAIPVIYGSKIKSDGGCGKLFYTPNLVKGRSKEILEVSGFLKKRWTGLTNPAGKNSINFTWLSDE